jgi:CheY-like chemotaxis protein
MKVLVIEDDPGIIEVVSLCFQLRWSGTSVISADNGRRGVELVETETPDVVILDIGLPDIDGYQSGARTPTSPGDWSWAPTTTSPSPSAILSLSPGCRRSCAAPRGCP